MSFKELIDDGTICEIELTKDELTKIILEGIDFVGSQDKHLYHITGVGYVIEKGVPAIRINVADLGYDDVEVKLK